jgi:hypothetical protein
MDDGRAPSRVAAARWMAAMRDLLRKTMCAALVVFIVSSIWVLAWARALEDRAQGTYYSPVTSDKADAGPVAAPAVITSAQASTDL